MGYLSLKMNLKDSRQLVQVWICTNWLDGCYVVKLVAKQTLDYLNFQ